MCYIVTFGISLDKLPQVLRQVSQKVLFNTQQEADVQTNIRSVSKFDLVRRIAFRLEILDIIVLSSIGLFVQTISDRVLKR